MKGSKKAELAYKFINTLYDPEIQAEIAKLKKAAPRFSTPRSIRKSPKLPGVFTPLRNGSSRSISTPRCAPRKRPMAQMVC